MYYGTNGPVQGTVQTGQENGGLPTYTRTDPHSLCPARASSPTKSLSSTNTAINPPPQMAQRTNPFPCCSGATPLSTREQYHRNYWLNEAGEGLTDEALLEWALDVLHSPEDWRWLWSPGPATTPSSSPTPNQLLSPWYSVSNVNPLNTSIPNALSTYAPSVGLPPPDTPNTPASCIPAPSAENLVMWASVVQLQLRPALPLSLPKWAILEDFESVPQSYECYVDCIIKSLAAHTQV